MPITRSSEQSSRTLEEFYTELAETSSASFANAGKEMLHVLDLINTTFKQTQLWGLTSHARLILRNTDDFGSDSLVIVNGFAGEYYIEYLLPPNKRPWNYAYVHGTATSLDELRQYLVIAMTESGGWPDNEELRQLRLALT
jgi:hypothetical protein